MKPWECWGAAHGAVLQSACLQINTAEQESQIGIYILLRRGAQQQITQNEVQRTTRGETITEEILKQTSELLP